MKPGTLVGTDQYAPPEAFTKSVTEALTCSFDIYSYGILSWEVITCEQAWKGLSPTELNNAVRKGQRPVLRGGQPFPTACPLTMRNITTEAWRQQPSDRPAFSDILRRMMTKSDVQWSADQLRTAENEARKKLTDALRVSARVRTPRQGSALAGLSSRSREANGMSPRGALKTSYGERHMSPRVSQVSPRVSQVSPRVSQVSQRVSQVPQRVTDRQATWPSGRATPVTKQGERKEKCGKLNPKGPRADDQGETKSSRPNNRENASSAGSLKSAAREKEKTTRAIDSSQLSYGRCSAQTLTRDEGFSESSFTDDQMSHEGSQCESGAVGGQSSDEPTKAADEAADEPAEADDEPAEAADEPAEAPGEAAEAPGEAADEPAEAADHDEPSEAADEPSEAADEPSEAADEPAETHDDEFDDEQAEPVTIQYRGLLRPDLILNVQPEAQQSAGNEIQPGETNRARDEEQISSSFDSNDETLVKVPFNEQIEDPDRDLRAEEGGQERRTQQIDGSGVVGCSSTTQLQPQALSDAETLQHQSQSISHGITEQHFNEAGPVGEINQQTAEQQTAEQETAETAQQEQNTSAAGEVVTAMTQPPTVPQVTTLSYPAVIYYDEADPEIAQVMQVAHLLRHTWGLKVFDPHRDGVGDKMTSFQHSFENSQHAVAVLTPSVIRNMRENRPNTASFRIATFLTGLLETHAQTCRRRLIPVQIGRDEIPFILCNFCVLRLGTSGFHRKLYRAVGNQTLSGDTGLPIRDLRGWADKMPQSEDTVNTVAAMLQLPPEVLIDIKEDFGGSRARLIEVCSLSHFFVSSPPH
ncbi:MAP3K20 [Branchiostoma lanceolatum]|nr:MAP3K20 [Branchiostoma lanceolatum]